MQISTLYKLVSFLTGLLILLSTLLFLQNKHYIPTISTLVSNLYHADKKATRVDSLQKLYALGSDKPVELSLALDKQSIDRTLRGLKHRLNTVLDVQKEPDGRIVKYILQVSENGKRYFSVDVKQNKLEGAFKTFKHYGDNGTVVIKLVPINPEWVQG